MGLLFCITSSCLCRIMFREGLTVQFHNTLVKSDISVSADKKLNVLQVLILSSDGQENESCIPHANRKENPLCASKQTLNESSQGSSFHQTLYWVFSLLLTT